MAPAQQHGGANVLSPGSASTDQQHGGGYRNGTWFFNSNLTARYRLERDLDRDTRKVCEAT